MLEDLLGIGMDKHAAKIKALTWKAARELFLKSRPDFVKIVDKLDPSDDFSIYVASYPYGRKIVDKGTLQLPTAEGKVTPIDAPNVDDKIKNNLKRRSVPLTFVLENEGEVFYEFPDRIISLNIFTPGNFFGLWENLDPTLSHFVKRIWSVSSGARSIYMLPKITDAGSHKELRKKCNLRSHIPKSLLDQWHIFVDLANSQEFEQEWQSSYAIFSDKWFEVAVKDEAWKDFYNFILLEGWNQSQYWRNKVTFDIVWELFTKSLIEQNIKPNPYFVSIVKHLVLIGVGAVPASAASDNQDRAGPAHYRLSKRLY